MTNLTLGGVVLGLRSKPYDFTDKETNLQNKGVSHRLFLWDQDEMEPVEIIVPVDKLGLASDLAQGLLVSVTCTVNARGNKATFRLDSVKSDGVAVFSVAKKAA